MEGVIKVSKYEDLEIGDHICFPSKEIPPGIVFHIHSNGEPCGNGEHKFICLLRDDRRKGGGCVEKGRSTWVVTEMELKHHGFKIDIPIKPVRLVKIIKKFKEDWNESQNI